MFVLFFISIKVAIFARPGRTYEHVNQTSVNQTMRYEKWVRSRPNENLWLSAEHLLHHLLKINWLLVQLINWILCVFNRKVNKNNYFDI